MCGGTIEASSLDHLRHGQRIVGPLTVRSHVQRAVRTPAALIYQRPTAAFLPPVAARKQSTWSVKHKAPAKWPGAPLLHHQIPLTKSGVPRFGTMVLQKFVVAASGLSLR